MSKKRSRFQEPFCVDEPLVIPPEELVAAVKKHANEHYNERGWDFCVEAMDTAEVLQIINDEGAETVDQAISAVGFVCELLDDKRRDIRATAW
jgi:hypothetical protein